MDESFQVRFSRFRFGGFPCIEPGGVVLDSWELRKLQAMSGPGLVLLVMGVLVEFDPEPGYRGVRACYSIDLGNRMKVTLMRIAKDGDEVFVSRKFPNNCSLEDAKTALAEMLTTLSAYAA